MLDQEAWDRLRVAPEWREVMLMLHKRMIKHLNAAMTNAGVKSDQSVVASLAMVDEYRTLLRIFSPPRDGDN